MVRFPSCWRSGKLFVSQGTSKFVVAAVVWWSLAWGAWAQPLGQFQWSIVDLNTREPLPCRIHLRNLQGQSIRVGDFPFWHDHFSCPGQLTVVLPPGKYLFEVERGPEWARASGYFIIQAHSRDNKIIGIRRLVDMRAQGWWAADLQVYRNPKHLPLLLQAEDLPLAHVISWNNVQNLWADKPLPAQPWVALPEERWVHLLGGEEQRRGGALLYLGMKQPLQFPRHATKLPSLTLTAAQAHEQKAWLDVAQPASWELPVWLALGWVRSVQVASSSLTRSASAMPQQGYLPDRRQLRGPWAPGLWNQFIYFQVLGAGFQIPPSAGSGSGRVGNPVGYNRVYAYLGPPQPGEKFDPQKWWQAFAQGRVVVTNGPLLRPLVQGQPPGTVFPLPSEGALELEATVQLDSRDPVAYVEVIHNGQVHLQVRVPELIQNGGKIALRFYEPGWFLFRAVADVVPTYRFALSGPFYIQHKDQLTISRSSVRFFQKWLQQARRRLRIVNPKQRAQVMKLYSQAEQFWAKRLRQANAP